MHRSDIEVLVNQIVFEEPLISESRKPQLRRLIYSKRRLTCNILELAGMYFLKLNCGCPCRAH